MRLTGGIQKGNGVMNVDKIPLNTLNLFLDNPIDLNGSLNFDLIYDRDKKSYEIPNINSVNTSVNKNDLIEKVSGIINMTFFHQHYNFFEKKISCL